jgi:hypothetical protein
VFLESLTEQLRQEKATAAKRRARRCGVNSNVTEAELHAKAFEQKGDALQMIERMLASRERSRGKLRKEDHRRRREDRREAAQKE